MKKIITLIFILSVCQNADAQITFQKRYQVAPGVMLGECVRQTNDNGFIISGESIGVTVSTFYSSCLMKTDASGNMVWNKTFDGLGEDHSFSALQTTDGGFIMTGWIADTPAAGAPYDVHIVKTNANGDTTWTKTIDINNGNPHAHAIQPTSDGGYIITGDDGNIFMLMKINASGNVQWVKNMGPTYNYLGTKGGQTSDGGYFICGSTMNSFYLDICFVRTDNNGNVLWAKTYGGVDDDYGYSALQTTDGGFIIAGTTESFGNFSPDVYLIRTDASGNILWSKTYGGTQSDNGYCAIQTSDGGFAVSGYTDSFGAGGADAYLIKTDGSGNVLWSKTFGSSLGGETAKSVYQTNDGGYVITGSTNGFGASNTNLYLIKTDSIGNIGCYDGNAATVTQTVATAVTVNNFSSFSTVNTISNLQTQLWTGGTEFLICLGLPTEINEPVNENIITIFPNPARNELAICNTQLAIESVEIYNTLGENVYNKSGTSQTCTETINVSKLSSGIYFVKVKTEKWERVAKFVKQ